MNDSVLFYSNHCQHSIEFLNKLSKNKEIDKLLMKICIDNKPKSSLPKYIKSVPTIVYNKNKMLSGDGVFEWLKSKEIIQEQNAEKTPKINSSMNSTQGMNLGYGGSQYYSFMNEESNVNNDMNSSFHNTFTNINDGFSQMNTNKEEHIPKKELSSNIERDYDRLINERRKDLQRK